MSKHLTAGVKILLAGIQLEERGHLPFTIEQLIIEAWKRYPATFGLRGFKEQHPDSHKIIAALDGDTGMLRRGLLDRGEETQTYHLTPAGRELAHDVVEAVGEPLGKGVPTPLAPKNALCERMNTFCDRVFACKAYETYRLENSIDDISWTDAHQLWGSEKGMIGMVLAERLQLFDECIDNLRTVLTANEGKVVLRNGREIDWQDMARLVMVDQLLRSKWKSHLSVLKSRKGKS